MINRGNIRSPGASFSVLNATTLTFWSQEWKITSSLATPIRPTAPSSVTSATKASGIPGSSRRTCSFMKTSDSLRSVEFLKLWKKVVSNILNYANCRRGKGARDLPFCGKTKSSAFPENAQSRFTSVVPDALLGPPRKALETWQYPRISVVPNATDEVRRGPFKGAMSSQKPFMDPIRWRRGSC